MADPKHATLYRMVMPDHICPYGLKSLDMLKRHGYTVDDHHLTSHEETEDFKRRVGVDTTPQTFIDGQRIGGNDELASYFGKPVKPKDAPSYQPIIALFVMALALAAAAAWATWGKIPPVRTLEWFVTFSMCLLALQKLRDVEGFSTMFLAYDLLARRWVRYAYLYPFCEALAGVLMMAGVLKWVSVPLALVIGSVGAVSVAKAVYIDKRELKCACVGGDSSVPLGFVSLTENLMMIGMAIWMLAKPVEFGP